MRLNVVPLNLQAVLRHHVSPAASYHQKFVNQVLNVADVARGLVLLVVFPEEGLSSLRIIESCC